MTIRSRIAATVAVASLTLVFGGQSHATVFAAWQVANVPFGDTHQRGLWQVYLTPYRSTVVD
ncbi:hypothetical protein [Mesorhizobium sp. B2-4-19]|uniref:hypothetical protein n=1 Tax=Mesorhizobium sp. B2-4-19 TaxID=2589930 RepID=UPI001FEDF65A|nr:hypothetical protein [Mesorhizobium sp. B2-4-19]